MRSTTQLETALTIKSFIIWMQLNCGRAFSLYFLFLFLSRSFCLAFIFRNFALDSRGVWIDTGIRDSAMRLGNSNIIRPPHHAQLINNSSPGNKYKMFISCRQQRRGALLQRHAAARVGISESDSTRIRQPTPCLANPVAESKTLGFPPVVRIGCSNGKMLITETGGWVAEPGEAYGVWTGATVGKSLAFQW